MQIIEEVADEGSSFYPRIDFLDEEGDPVTPTAVYWKLTDLQGNVINSRSQVEVPIPGSYVTIALSGDDLTARGDDLIARLITVWGTYTSQVHGAGCPFSIQVKFNIQPRVGG